MNNLLIEFLCEEIPARMQAKAAQDLGQLLSEQLKALGLTFENIQTYVTPRRLAVSAMGIPTRQEAVAVERRGPRVDAPQAALDGFISSTGLSLAQCEQRETPKGTFYFATITQPPQETSALLPGLITHILSQLSWPKSMCWGLGSHVRWVRPLHNIMCIFAGKPVALNLTIPSTPHTLGHRFLSSGNICAHDGPSYVENLRAAQVLVCPQERRQAIACMVQKAASDKNLQIILDESLLDEITGLVEWPHVLMGSIDEDFMSLPKEILMTVMRHHQRYFALETKQGILAPFFITVANSLFADGGKTATRGNEHVLRARLSDARFFWDEDQKNTLEGHGKTLSRLIFHTKLGTLADKCQRIGTLAHQLNETLQLGLDHQTMTQTAQLIKADLTTQTVIELPELQGVIGHHLGKHEGLAEPINQAIRDHYAPNSAQAPVAKTPLSILMALSDKLDTLAGFFLIGEKPTGSKDPYALRRACLGIIRTVLENRLEHFTLSQAFASAIKGYPTLGDQSEKTRLDLINFFQDRLKVYLRDAGFTHDVATAAMNQDDSLIRIWDKAFALKDFLNQESSALLLQGFKRASNILSNAKDWMPGPCNISLFSQTEEQSLYTAYEEAHAEMKPMLSHQTQENIEKILCILSALSPALNAFFEAVMVNAPDPQIRINRLNLLHLMQSLFLSLLDFNVIEGA